ncbi:MAG: hypothetical protein WD749_04845 [Phycisphaerales bacterium]
MSGRVQALLIGPIAAMLALHVVALVLWERGITPRAGTLGELWGPWNLAAPIFLLIAGSYALRHAAADERADPSRLVRITWGTALADLLLSAALAALLWQTS